MISADSITDNSDGNLAGNQCDSVPTDVSIGLRMVAVTQPRRVAAITVAHRVASERGGDNCYIFMIIVVFSLLLYFHD